MSLDLSLYQIESDLANLIEMREQTLESLKLAESEGDPPQTERLNEEAAQIDNAIREYIASEIRKVDNIRSFWRHCELMRDAAKEEARVQSDRSKAWGARLDRLKATCALVMESIPFPAGKPKKLEGRTGALLLKANGGKQAVEVTDASLAPDELSSFVCSFSGATNPALVVYLRSLAAVDFGVKLTRAPSLSPIGEQLAKDEGVPGARLAERGSHVECK